MTDDENRGLPVPAETSGFEREPEPPHVGRAVEAAARANGHSHKSDDQQIGDRLRQIEEWITRQRDAEFSAAEALVQFRSELGQQAQVIQQISQIVGQLSQQRAMQEFIAERNARSAALDLAIKALPEKDRDAQAIVTYAEAFLSWLKSGTQA